MNLYNRSLFRDNGRCGYVLKPQFLRNANPEHLSPSGNEFQPMMLEITILHARHLPNLEKRSRFGKSRTMDPYVKVRIILEEHN